MGHSSATGLNTLWSPLANHFVKKYCVASGLFPILKQTWNFIVKQAVHLILLVQNILILLKSELKQMEKSILPLLWGVKDWTNFDMALEKAFGHVASQLVTYAQDIVPVHLWKLWQQYQL